jgi:hypothetical protein
VTARCCENHDPKLHFVFSDIESGTSALVRCSCGSCDADLDEVYKGKLDEIYVWLNTGKTPRMIQEEKDASQDGIV